MRSRVSCYPIDAVHVGRRPRWTAILASFPRCPSAIGELIDVVMPIAQLAGLRGLTDLRPATLSHPGSHRVGWGLQVADQACVLPCAKAGRRRRMVMARETEEDEAWVGLSSLGTIHCWEIYELLGSVAVLATSVSTLAEAVASAAEVLVYRRIDRDVARIGQAIQASSSSPLLSTA